MNPFLVPGLEDDPEQALCPWDENMSDHDNYYINIGGSQNTYETFQQTVRDGSGLIKNGRLVIVLGQDGCGKTSMINRCVYWIITELRPHGFDARVIDLRTLPQNQSVQERIKAAASLFADLVLQEDVLAANLSIDIAQRKDEPANLYQLTSRQLAKKFLLLVLLPPITLIEARTELTREITDYAKLVAGRIVFFMEITLPGESFDMVPSPATSPAPIRLTVHPLTSDDSVLFGLSRLRLDDPPADYPIMNDETLQDLVLKSAKPRSAKFLQKVLHGVYEQRRTENDRYSRRYQVEYSEITKYVYQNM